MKQRRLPFQTASEETAAAITAGEENADADWKELALDAIRKTCVERREFISDDIWDLAELPSTRDDRALGGIMLRAAGMNWCVKTDRMRRSKRSHFSGKPVWRSLLFGGSKN